MSDIVRNSLQAIEQAIGTAASFTPLHEPEFSGNEWTYVKECIDTAWVSSVGAYVDRFEKDMADYTGAKYAVSMVNGTAALHLSLVVVGVAPQEEVICPSLSFVATTNAISYCQAIPHFADIADDTLGLDPAKLDSYFQEIGEKTADGLINKQTGRVIRAVVCMHTFGHPVDLDLLLDVCAKWNVTLVEDAAESLGSKYKGRHCGTFGLVSAVSFNGNKLVTTGGGGCLLTNDEAIAKKAKHLATTAKVPHPWLYVHDEVGFNYRMPNLNAALGCAQLEQLDGFLQEKRQLAARYAAAFSDVEGVRFFTETDFAESNYWLNAIILDKADLKVRDEMLETLNQHDYMARPAWTLLHKLKPFSDMPRMSDLSVADRIEESLINIPSSPKLARS